MLKMVTWCRACRAAYFLQLKQQQQPKTAVSPSLTATASKTETRRHPGVEHSIRRHFFFGRKMILISFDFSAFAFFIELPFSEDSVFWKRFAHSLACKRGRESLATGPRATTYFGCKTISRSNCFPAGFLAAAIANTSLLRITGLEYYLNVFRHSGFSSSSVSLIYCCSTPISLLQKQYPVKALPVR